MFKTNHIAVVGLLELLAQLPNEIQLSEKTGKKLTQF